MVKKMGMLTSQAIMLHAIAKPIDVLSLIFNLLRADKEEIGHHGYLFSRMLRDSTPRFVRPSVSRSHFHFFGI